MRRVLLARIASVAFGIAETECVPVPDRPPIAPIRPVTDVYFGTKVVDPYRWMENRTSPEFVRYMLAQGAYTRRALGGIPGRDRLEARVAAHTGGGVAVRFVLRAGGRIFFLKRAPTDDTFRLYLRETASGPDRLLVDPDRFASRAQHASIDWYMPSQHAENLAFGISLGGSEQSVIHVLDIASGKEFPETIDRAENGSVSWLPDASAFFYNRMAATRAGDPETARYLNSRALLHRLGDNPDSDVALIGTGVAGSPPVNASDVPSIYIQSGADRALAIISHGSEPALELLLAPLAQAGLPGAHWRKVADSPDGVTGFALHGNTLYLLMHRGAPRCRIVALDLANPQWALTVGVAMVERPDLFRVVFSDVGDSNALRAEFETDGDANALEYGSVKTVAGFRGLLAMDALSHVKDGVAYPAALFTTGLNDPRVAPWQPGKMAARLQRATSSGRPILLRVDTDAGHGAGPTKQQNDRLTADQLAFLYWQIRKPEYQPAK